MVTGVPASTSSIPAAGHERDWLPPSSEAPGSQEGRPVTARPGSDQQAEPENAEGPEPAVLPFCAEVTQILAQNAASGPSRCRKSRAGDGIRTHDVQPGNWATNSAEHVRKRFSSMILQKNPPIASLCNPSSGLAVLRSNEPRPQCDSVALRSSQGRTSPRARSAVDGRRHPFTGSFRPYLAVFSSRK